MNDKFIDDLLDQPIPDADENARKLAVNTALSEFSQGIDKSARLSDEESITPSNNHSSLWSNFMTILTNPNSGKVFATVAVAFVAVSLAVWVPDYEQSSVRPDIVSEPEILADIQQTSPPTDGSAVSGLQQSADSSRVEEITVTAAKNPASQQAAAPVANAPATKAEPQRELQQSFGNNQLGGQIAPLASKPAPSPANRRSGKSIAVAEQAINSGVAYPLPAPAPDPLTPVPDQRPDVNEEYAPHQENSIKLVSQEPVSTFSIDVDTASYSLVRNQLLRGYLPAPTAVRAEEMINYFDYAYPLPGSKQQPFEPTVTVFDSPWNSGKKLVHIGIKGYDITKDKQPDSNLVFLLDVSGSMNAQNKLPLVKQSIGLLLDTLKPSDTISLVVYAGAAGTVLEPTKVSQKTKILSALQNLQAGGSTAGGQGIELAYQLAEQNYNEQAVNRIILATDGDFNVGLQSNEALKTLVERKRDKGVFLSVLGFGRNNYQDDMMQTLAQNGNGVAAYIDSLSEAKKVLVDEATSTLFTIAKDVKIQIEFNAATVKEYRLIGYETRHLNREDFNNDKVDAGDIGAGHTVTAIYEITPVGASNAAIDELRYAENRKTTATSGDSNEYGFLKIRYKLPNEKKSQLISQAITKTQGEANQDILFSTAAAGFAQLLKGGKHTPDLSLDDIAKLAQDNKGQDPYGYRAEFIQLVNMAKIAKP